ncbi:MAG: hypothetical protein HDR20_08360 [Lachnospiraceae bacterium]|nr:hypothetical protein [Lachnospiraceae bacterium]
MRVSRKAVITLMAVMLSLSGCKNNQTVVDETLPMESNKEEEDIQNSKSIDEVADAAVETVQQEDITEKEEKIELTYKGDALLVEDNVAQVLKDFLSIADEEDLKKLEELPLTENFFNQCAEDFPYIEDVEEYKEINIEFWSIDEEGKCVSLVVFSKTKNPEYVTVCRNPDHVYCIEMDIVGDQIDAVRMEVMR